MLRSISIMLLVLITIGIINYKDGLKIVDNKVYSNVEDYLEKLYGYDYYKVLGFKSLKIFNYYILKIDLFDEDLDLPNFNSSYKEETIKLSIDYMKQFDYDYNQNSPSIMLKEGNGNCQAMSIVMKCLLEKNGINSQVVLTPNHAYNVVNLDDKKYTIDIANLEVVLNEY